MSDLYTSRLLAIPPSLFFLVPLAAIVLVLLVVSAHRPLVAHPGTVVLVSCAVAALTVISILAGAVGLRATTGPFALTAAESIIQAVLEFALGVSSLYLVYPFSTGSIPSRLYASFLIVLLLTATVTNLVAPFKLMPAVIPRVLVLAFSFSLLPLITAILRPYQRRFPLTPSPPPLVAPLPSPASSATSFPSQETHVHAHNPTHEKTPSLDSILTVTAVDHSPTLPFPSIIDPESLSTRLHAQEPHTRLHEPHFRPHPQEEPHTRPYKHQHAQETRALLLILLAAQTCAFIACVLDVVGVAGRSKFDTRTQALLRIVQIAFAVLCVVGVLGAYMHSLYITRPTTPKTNSNSNLNINTDAARSFELSPPRTRGFELSASPSARGFELSSSPRARAAAAVARAISTAGPADKYYYPPEDGHHSPESGYSASGGRYRTPADGYRAPEDRYGALKDGYRTPREGYHTPRDGYRAPEDGYRTPGDGYRTPREGYHTPRDGYRTAGDKYGAPLGKHYMPAHEKGKTDDAASRWSLTSHTPESRYASHAPESRYTPAPRRVQRKATPAYTSADHIPHTSTERIRPYSPGERQGTYSPDGRQGPRSPGERQGSPNTRAYGNTCTYSNTDTRTRTSTGTGTGTKRSPKLEGQTCWPRLNSLSAKVPPPLTLAPRGVLVDSTSGSVMGVHATSVVGVCAMPAMGVHATSVMSARTEPFMGALAPNAPLTLPTTVHKATYASFTRPLKAIHARFSSASSSFSSPDTGRDFIEAHTGRDREVGEVVMDLRPECGVRTDFGGVRPDFGLEDGGRYTFPPERCSVFPFPTSIVPSGSSPSLLSSSPALASSGSSPPMAFPSPTLGPASMSTTTPVSASSSCFPTTSTSSSSCLPTASSTSCFPTTSSASCFPATPSSSTTHTPTPHNLSSSPTSSPLPPKPKRAAKHMSVRVTSYRFPFPFPRPKCGVQAKDGSDWAYGGRGIRDGIGGYASGNGYWRDMDKYGGGMDGDGMGGYRKDLNAYRSRGDSKTNGDNNAENHNDDHHNYDEGDDGFMDLRDPFASSTGVVVRHSSVMRNSNTAVRDSVPGVIRDSGISMVEAPLTDSNGDRNKTGAFGKAEESVFEGAEFGTMPVKERTSASVWGKLPALPSSPASASMLSGGANAQLDCSRHDGGVGMVPGVGFSPSQSGGLNTVHGGGFGTSINMAMMGGIAFAGRLGRGFGGGGNGLMSVYAGAAYPSPPGSSSSSSRGSKASKGSVGSKVSKGSVTSKGSAASKGSVASKIPRTKGGVSPTASASSSSSSSRLTGRKQGTRIDVYAGSKEDVDFDVEEALLAQRLLRRLNGMGEV